MAQTTPQTSTLPIRDFWSWLKQHSNCIVRAGGLGFTHFDLADIHWCLSEEEDGLLVLHLIRGKDTQGEMVFHLGDVLYVQGSPDEGENVMFECVATGPDGPTPLCYFLMAHSYDEPSDDAEHWTH
ncbi:MAG: hypothetical protein AUK47_23365 [Deltaproteobacteria bacterium CG2_30_63_29]|nr:MAG: hypothetical protein AUK47_23365 [Deltaproteobacteria bacterium CG2_30_63_29]PJB40067.1 MAG: hypothetical protein CO108_15685 [Deltaproteobacteria bacterium CG_4_9_14_3_um_filter_63_12]